MLPPAKNNFLFNLSIILLVAAVYAITGYSGLFFATPPGYATAIWIPSGIALGAVLVWGLRVLPGVFLGSLITNFFISTHLGSLFTSIMIGIVIASGAALQTLAGWYLIKKWVGIKNILNKPNDILLFALLSGPIACLVNTTWSNTALLLLSMMSSEKYLLNWLTWWIGDSMGVLIFTPTFLILFAKPKKIWRQRILPILLPLCVCFTVVILAYVNVYSTQFSWQLWSVLISGLLFCVLVNIVLFIIHGQKNIAQTRMNEKSSALAFSESKNELILRTAGEGIYGIDNEGRTTFINPAAARMLGYEENEILGKVIHDLIHYNYADYSNYPAQECPIYSTYKYGSSHHITNEGYWRRDGSFFWVEYTSTPIMDGKKPIGAVVVFSDVSERRQFEYELEKMAHYDVLTSLPNRNSFLEQLTLSVDRAKQNNNSLAVCFIDLDNFKQINDSLGHSIGDETLKITAKLLKTALNDADYFSRLGGDEFGVIIENIISEEEMRIKFDDFIEAVNKIIRISNVEIHLSISIGAAIYPIAGLVPEELIMNADIAMYHAKESGKNTYAFFDDEINKQVKRRNQIDMKMRTALAKNEFSLNYQLQVDTQDMQPFGLETLLRWHNDELGDISPSEFIPIAEANGLIQKIGEWVLRQSCLDYVKIMSNYPNKELILSINISVAQLENTNFLKKLKTVLNETKMKHENLLLEITETALMRNPKHTLEIMDHIMELGIRFALDDFGVSYSSMQYLKNLPVSLIKIDQGFITDMLANSNDAKIVNAIIQLSHGMNIHTLAEGVETKEQFQLLKEMGCEYLQGYYFATPMSLNELLKYLTQLTNKISD